MSSSAAKESESSSSSGSSSSSNKEDSQPSESSGQKSCSLSQIELNPGNKPETSSEEEKNYEISDRLTISNPSLANFEEEKEFQYFNQHSQLNYIPQSDMMESRSEGKADTSFYKDTSKLEAKSFGIKLKKHNEKTEEESKQVEKDIDDEFSIEMFNEKVESYHFVEEFIGIQDKLEDY
jgi:hypothetical protein